MWCHTRTRLHLTGYMNKAQDVEKETKFKHCRRTAKANKHSQRSCHRQLASLSTGYEIYRYVLIRCNSSKAPSRICLEFPQHYRANTFAGSASRAAQVHLRCSRCTGFEQLAMRPGKLPQLHRGELAAKASRQLSCTGPGQLPESS